MFIDHKLRICFNGFLGRRSAKGALIFSFTSFHYALRIEFRISAFVSAWWFVLQYAESKEITAK
jgi:hypothetical protein